MLCGEPGRTRTFSVLKINQAVNQTVGLKMFFNPRKDSNLLSPDDRRAVYQTVGGLLAPVYRCPAESVTRSTRGLLYSRLGGTRTLSILMIVRR